MNIVRKNLNNAYFSELKITDVFELGGCLWMKTKLYQADVSQAMHSLQFNAVNLEDGSYAFFADRNYVKLKTAELTVE